MFYYTDCSNVACGILLYTDVLGSVLYQNDSRIVGFLIKILQTCIMHNYQNIASDFCMCNSCCFLSTVYLLLNNYDSLNKSCFVSFPDTLQSSQLSVVSHL